LLDLEGGVDAEWYRSKYPEVGPNVDAVAHYAIEGWRQGRDPTTAFSTRWYLSQNPDVAAAGLNPFVHYLQHGRAEGRGSKPTLLDALRVSEWWSHKISPMLAAFYGTALLSGVSVLSLWPALLLALIAIAPGAAYVSLINDWTDRPEDQAAGKRNALLGKSGPVVALLFAGCIVPGLLVAAHWRNEPLLVGLYLAAWLVFSLYSLPPVRLKKRGIFGVLADASGAHLFPTLLLVALVYRWQEESINAVWFAAVGLWSFCHGLRGILWHQSKDRDHDVTIGIRTFAQRHSVARLRSLAHRVVFPLELMALSVMLWLLANPVVLASLLSYFLWKWWLSSGLKYSVIVAPNEADILKDREYRLLLFGFYETLLPLALLISSPCDIHSTRWYW
jgi:4-hydroxybenzoate polyprenyltransferase